MIIKDNGAMESIAYLLELYQICEEDLMLAKGLAEDNNFDEAITLGKRH